VNGAALEKKKWNDANSKKILEGNNNKIVDILPYAEKILHSRSESVE